MADKRMADLRSTAVSPHTMQQGNALAPAPVNSLAQTAVNPNNNFVPPKITGINRLIDVLVRNLNPSLFPTAGKLFIETAQGERRPITEKDFSPEEKLSFKKFVKELANSKAFKVGKGLAKGVTRTVGASLPVIGGGFVALGVNDVAKAAEMGIVSPDELAVAYNFGPEAAQLFKDYKAEEMKPTLAGKKDTPAIDDYTGNKLFGNYNEQIKNIKLP